MCSTASPGSAVLRSDPELGGLEEMRPALLPRARRRNPNELEPGPDGSPVAADHLDDLLVPARAISHEAPERVGLPLEVALVGTRPARAQPPVALRRPDPDRERPVVAARDDVDRRAHERGLHDGAPLERACQVVAAKTFETRPEPDVRVRRVLVLDTADPFERSRDRHTSPLEQELAGEERAVQLALRESALRHRATVPDDRASETPCAVAIPPMTSAPPTASHTVTGSSRKSAPNATASGEIAYVYETARVGPIPLRPTFQKM